jgi:DNA-binding MarR family transcriptional regulator
MKKFTLFDFPEDRVYILLEDAFRKEFFDKAIEMIGSQSTLARRLKVSITMIEKWRARKNKSQKGVCEQAIPLWAIIKLSNIANSQKFSMEKIQNAVVKYRAKGGFSVMEPNLPLIENKQLIRIFFHLAGDGFAGHFAGAQVNYYNKNKAVMKEFIDDLSVFGKTELRLRENGKRLGFPKVIGHILQHIYQTNFKSSEIKIPPHFFRIKKGIILQGLKAIMDDEGWIEFNRIGVSIKNKSFLLDIAKLFQTKTPLRNYIRIGKLNKIPTLKVTSEGMEWYKQHIGFSHSQKKKDLDFYLKIKRKRRGLIGDTKIKILQSLLAREKTTREISSEIKLSPSMVLSHIKGKSSRHNLENAHLIERTKHSNDFVWKLTKTGKMVLKSFPLRNNNLGLEKYIIGFWIFLKPGERASTLSEFFGVDVSKMRNHIKTMLNKKLLSKEGKGTVSDPYRFQLTERGKKWIKNNVDFISNIVNMVICLKRIGSGKILSINSPVIKYIGENFQKLKNKVKS